MPAIRASRSANSLQYPPSDDEGAPAPRSAAFTLSPLIISSPLPTTGRNSPVSAVTAPPDSPVSYSGESSPLLLEQPYLPAPTTRAALHPPPALPRLLPDPSFRFPNSTDVTSSDARPATAPTNQGARAGPGLTKSSSISSMSSTSTTESTPYTAPPTSARSTLAHPYARIYAKKADPAVKRRRMWNHALEKSVFTPEEIATLGAQARRTMYTASLEAHVDKLHEQLRAIGLTPIAPERLEPYHGLNVITVKSMVAGLHKDSSDIKTKLMELERAKHVLHRNAEALKDDSTSTSLSRRHSVAAPSYVYPNLFSAGEKTVIS